MGGGKEEAWEEVRRKKWMFSNSRRRGERKAREKFLPRKMERINEAERLEGWHNTAARLAGW